MPQKLSELSPQRLPFLTNRQYETVIELARDFNMDLNACPTCNNHQEEKAPGIRYWPQSSYRLLGKEYPCNCEWQDKLRRHYLLAGVPISYWTLSEDDFFGDQEALQFVHQYLDNWTNWKRHGVGLALHSSTQGTGKTMLATIVARHLIRRGERAYFTSFRDTIKLYDMPYEVRVETEKRLRRTPILIIDEVVPSITDAQRAFFAEELEDLIRFRTSGNNVTLLTTNLTREELDKEFPRIFSLLSHKQRHVTVQGHDVRRAGEVDLFMMELIENGEARPIV